MHKQDGSERSLIAEALAFYQLPQGDQLVVCHLLVNQTCVLGAWKGMWSSDLTILKAKDIKNKVAIWQPNSSDGTIWTLRKHPGLEMLEASEVGASEAHSDDEDDDDN